MSFIRKAKQFESRPLSKPVEELDPASIHSMLAEGGCDNVGVIFSLAQIVRQNIDLSDDYVGLTLIHDGANVCDVAETNGNLKVNKNIEVSTGKGSFKDYPVEIPNESSMERRMRLLREGKEEMDKVNSSLEAMLWELELDH